MCIRDRIQIDTTTAGPTAELHIDTNVASTLNDILGFAAGGVALTGLTVAALDTAVYVGATVVIDATTITALSTFSDLTTAQQADLVEGIQDVVAPRLVETGQALLSFAYGVMGALVDATFQPGGTRSGLPAGVAADIVTDDGTAVFTL